MRPAESKGKVAPLNTSVVEVFWRDYETLKPRERKELAERILRDSKLLEDMFDHRLIEKAKRVKGRPVTLNDYESLVCREKAG